MSQESKAEKRIDVEIPPKTRPRNKIGSASKSVHAQASV